MVWGVVYLRWGQPRSGEVHISIVLTPWVMLINQGARLITYCVRSRAQATRARYRRVTGIEDAAHDLETQLPIDVLDVVPSRRSAISRHRNPRRGRPAALSSFTLRLPSEYSSLHSRQRDMCRIPEDLLVSQEDMEAHGLDHLQLPIVIL